VRADNSDNDDFAEFCTNVGKLWSGDSWLNQTNLIWFVLESSV